MATSRVPKVMEYEGGLPASAASGPYSTNLAGRWSARWVSNAGFAWLALGNAGIDMQLPLRFAPFVREHGDSRLETAAARQRDQGDKAIQGDRAAPPKGGDGSRGAAGNVGGYNTGWLDPGSTYTVVNGETRSAFIVDPPDGRVPPVSTPPSTN